MKRPIWPVDVVMCIPPATQRFQSRWYELASTLGLVRSKATEIGDYLIRQYAGEHRYYHSVQHIAFMLDEFTRLRARFADPHPIELAIFFHDVIYDPGRSDNEAQSALRLCEMLGGAVNPAVLDAARLGIEATRSHVATSSHDTNLLIDLDMAILGQPWPVYARYASDVMREYLRVYDEDVYRNGRIKQFLEPTLARGGVFLTDDFRPLNEPALSNLRREAEILTSGDSLES